MSAQFLAASSHYITQGTDALLTTAGPFTIGLWLHCDNLPGAEVNFMSIGATSAQRVWDITITTAGAIWTGYFNGSANGYQGTTNGTVAAGVWSYFLMRRISNSSKRTVALRGGNINHTSETSNFAAGALDRITLAALMYNSAAATNFFTGRIAEFFYANADIQPGGGVMDESLLRQIAYNGPFSVPHIVPLIAEYHSLRGPTWQQAGEDYQRGASRSWVPVNGVTWSHHPPLSSEYVRPGQTRRLLTV
jgi:hypothetical protein